MDGDGLDTFEKQVLLDIVHLILVIAKNDDGRSGLLQAFKQIDHLGLLLDIFDDLQDVEVGSTRSTDIDKYGTDEGLLREILNLSRHRSGEK
jgi:hypothetical protein